jgi:superoxide dismutase, Cu-Zn family
MQGFGYGAGSCGRALVIYVAIFGATLGHVTVPAAAVGEKAFAEMRGRDGRELGRIRLYETTAGVLMRIKLKGLAPGAHGFHIHEVGKCEADFESAGGILNPLGAKHGYLNDEGPMVGDLPNLIVPASGDIEVEFLSPFATLAKDAEDTLLDNNGSALVIFEKPDDYTTDPLGNTGARLACGAITTLK